jgi:hypothetical protein
VNIKLSKSPATQDLDKGTQLDRISREICDYLHSHPAAAESLDGILDWWLPTHRNENAKNEILRALQDMVQRGLLVEAVLDNGSRRYRLTGDKGK